MDRDRHDARRLRAVEVEPVELVAAAAEDLVGRLLLDGADDDVVDLDRVGNRDDRRRRASSSGTGCSSSTQSATYSMPASASRSSVSSVSVRPGLSQPRGGLPVKSLIASMVSAMAARWSSTLCIGLCTKPWPMKSQPASRAACAGLGVELADRAVQGEGRLQACGCPAPRGSARSRRACRTRARPSSERRAAAAAPSAAAARSRGIAPVGLQFSTLTMVHTATRALLGSLSGGRRWIGV